MSAHALGALWKSIEDTGPLGAAAIRFLEAGLDFPTGAVLAGVDGRGHRHLCIPAPAAELGREDQASRGVTIDVRPLLDPAGRERPFVDVLCKRPDLNPLFEVVAAEILVESRKCPGSPFAVSHQVLERWRELLEPGEEMALGSQQLAALLAELLLLERLGRDGVPPLSSWMGPQRETHDFVCGAIDFEVKSTLTTTGRKVEIHGLAQLSPSPNTRLYLWWIRLRVSPGRGTTVPATLERLVARGVDRVALMKVLKDVGYLQRDASRYAEVSFETVESALYLVDGSFPRLTTDSFVGGLPPHITQLNYSVILDAPHPRALSDNAANEVFDSVEGAT